MGSCEALIVVEDEGGSMAISRPESEAGLARNRNGIEEDTCALCSVNSIVLR